MKRWFVALVCWVVLLFACPSCLVFDESMRRPEDGEGPVADGKKTTTKAAKEPKASAAAPATAAPPERACSTVVAQRPFQGICAWALSDSDEHCGTIPTVWASGELEREPHNNCTAQALEANTPICGVVAEGDVDIYELPVSAGTCYRVDLDLEGFVFVELSGPGMPDINTETDQRIKETGLAVVSGVLRIVLRGGGDAQYKLAVR